MKKTLTPIVAAIFAAALSLSACATAPVEPITPAGDNFLARNATAKKVVSLPGGLQYFVLASGPKRGPHPAATDTVTFDYEGKLTNGETFDSSYARGQPISGRADQFVPGFTQALTLMRPGDIWIVWIPPQLGYGSQATGPIPGGSVLRFKLALKSVAKAS